MYIIIQISQQLMLHWTITAQMCHWYHLLNKCFQIEQLETTLKMKIA